MVKGSVIKLPNGTVIEVSPNMTPDQITALVTAVTSTGVISTQSSSIDTEAQSGMTYNADLSPNELWQSSKKERVALFIRMAFSENYWFTAKEVLEEQLTHTTSLVLGETSAIATYLARLFENGYLDRQKSGSRAVKYRLTDKILLEYPIVETIQFNELLTLEFND
ncbi:MAG: hypothetical protein GPJ54_02820 [Candidatus Heimdallarchaeota archaeon]|nr:hypothetical protein [Candidatus Heimdallarchaeota archaeon]